MVPVVAEVRVLDAAVRHAVLGGQEQPVALYRTYSWFLLWLRSDYLMQPYATLFWAARSLVPYLLMVPVEAEVGILDAAVRHAVLSGQELCTVLTHGS